MQGHKQPGPHTFGTHSMQLALQLLCTSSAMPHRHDLLAAFVVCVGSLCFLDWCSLTSLVAGVRSDKHASFLGMALNCVAVLLLPESFCRVFHRPCLRCMSDGGHKCGNGCWFCSNCQRMWGKLNPISDEQAWKTITTGVGIDPRFVARRRGMGVGQLADAAPPVTVMAVTDSKQPSAHVAITPAPAAGATTELPV